MSGNNDQDQQLDPVATAAQAAALAQHLQRSGLQWLPQPNLENVARLKNQMNAAAVHGDSATGPQAGATRQFDPSQATTSKPAREADGKLPRETTPQTAKTDANPPITTSYQSPLRHTGPREGLSQLANEVMTDGVTGRELNYPGESLAQDTRKQQLQQLNQSVAVCTRCEILASCRKQTVFGEGAVNPRVVFFGEAPGAQEDRQGRPFVGPAGDLLTKMIEACKFQREEVYILNVIKCRPPGNRNPDPVEISQCREYYQQQLAILRPEYIVCLGAVSSQELLQSQLSVGRLRGKFHRYFESKVLVTYHPAYLLRNPTAKKAAWLDLQIMLRDAKIQY